MKPKHFSLFATFFVAVGSLLGTSLNFDFEEDNSLIYDDTSSHFVGIEKAPEGAIPTSLTIYYRMNIPNYNEKRFWLWAGGQDGVELEADGVDENYGMYVTINPADWPALTKMALYRFGVSKASEVKSKSIPLMKKLQERDFSPTNSSTGRRLKCVVKVLY